MVVKKIFERVFSASNKKGMTTDPSIKAKNSQNKSTKIYNNSLVSKSRRLKEPFKTRRIRVETTEPHQIKTLIETRSKNMNKKSVSVHKVNHLREKLGLNVERVSAKEYFDLLEEKANDSADEELERYEREQLEIELKDLNSKKNLVEKQNIPKCLPKKKSYQLIKEKDGDLDIAINYADSQKKIHVSGVGGETTISVALSGFESIEASSLNNGLRWIKHDSDSFDWTSEEGKKTLSKKKQSSKKKSLKKPLVKGKSKIKKV